MLLSAVSVLVVAQSSSEIPEGLMNNPVFYVLPTFRVSLWYKCILNKGDKGLYVCHLHDSGNSGYLHFLLHVAI